MPTENNALSDEISRRRTQSATYTTSNSNIGLAADCWRKDGSPRSHADWGRFGNSHNGNSGTTGGSNGSGGNGSSPISIQHLNSQLRNAPSQNRQPQQQQQQQQQQPQQVAGSIGSAILSGVFSNHSGEPARSHDDGTQQYVQKLHKKCFEYEQCYNQVRIPIRTSAFPRTSVLLVGSYCTLGMTLLHFIG